MDDQGPMPELPGSSRIPKEAPPPFTWEPPDPSVEVDKLQVRSAFRRTIDTFVANWRPFVALSIPTAALAALVLALASDTRTTTNNGTSIVLSLLATPVNLVLGLAMIFTAADIRGGIGPSIGGAVTRAAHRAGAAIVALLVVAGAGIAIWIIPLAALVNAGLTNAGGLVVLVLLVLGVYLLLRWSLWMAAVALQEAGPIEGLRASWRLGRGNVWRLAALFLAVAAVEAPLSIAGALFISATILPVAVAISLIGPILIGPLGSIAIAVAYGDLTKREELRLLRPAATRWRSPAYVAVVVAAGLVLSVFGTFKVLDRIGLFEASLVPVGERGTVFAGTAPNPAAPCKIVGRSDVLDAKHPIYIAGYYERPLFPGDVVTVTYFVNVTRTGSIDLPPATEITSCYAADPVTLRPGRYIVVLSHDREKLAEGTFTVK